MTTTCPFCEAEISSTAVKCKYCGEWLEGDGAPQRVGSAGHVVAALASFVLPGLGQLAQSRLLAGLFLPVLAGALWLVGLGWIVHLIAGLDAAAYKTKSRPRSRRARPAPVFARHEKVALALAFSIIALIAYAALTRPSAPATEAESEGTPGVVEEASRGGDRQWAQGTVNVRSAPGMNGAVVNQLSTGQPVLVGPSDGDGWQPILSPSADTLGYVFAQLLGDSIAAPPQAPDYGRLVVCDEGERLGSVNLWSSPQRQRVVTRVPTGTSCQGPRIEILRRQAGRCSGDCVQIRVVESGATGWVSEIFVTR